MVIGCNYNTYVEPPRKAAFLLERVLSFLKIGSCFCETLLLNSLPFD